MFNVYSFSNDFNFLHVNMFNKIKNNTIFVLPQLDLEDNKKEIDTLINKYLLHTTYDSLKQFCTKTSLNIVILISSMVYSALLNVPYLVNDIFAFTENIELIDEELTFKNINDHINGSCVIVIKNNNINNYYQYLASILAFLLKAKFYILLNNKIKFLSHKINDLLPEAISNDKTLSPLMLDYIIKRKTNKKFNIGYFENNKLVKYKIS